MSKFASLQATDRKNVEILKIPDGGCRYLENHKNRDITATN